MNIYTVQLEDRGTKYPACEVHVTIADVLEEVAKYLITFNIFNTPKSIIEGVQALSEAEGEDIKVMRSVLDTGTRTFALVVTRRTD